MPSSAWIRWVKGCLNSHKWGGKDVEEVSIQYKFHDRWQISFYWRRFYFLTLFSFALLSNKMIKPITNARGTVLLCNSLCFYNGNRGSYDNIQFTTVLIFQNQRVLMSRVCWSIKLFKASCSFGPTKDEGKYWDCSYISWGIQFVIYWSL